MNSYLKRFYATVKIRDLNRVKFLRCLWENAQPAAFYKVNDVNPPMVFCEKTARNALQAGYRIDYHQGRAIKMNMHTDTIDNSTYVKYWGHNAFQRALAKAKQEK